MKRTITNIGASNFRKLLHKAKQSNTEFNALLKRYLQERFLYRLSESKYKNNFILKGGLLLITIDIPSSRPTLDIDFLAKNINKEKIEFYFQEICKINTTDGIKFDENSVKTEEIIKEGDYKGIRVKIKAYFHTSQTDISIDVGLGDIVLNQREITFPCILSDKAPVLNAYSLETIVAEKLEAMAKLLYANSRMKDFYDVYTILNTGNINLDNLKEAIQLTFSNRGTDIKNLNTIFANDFYKEEIKQKQWAAFLKKNHINLDKDFANTVLSIKDIITKLI
ncbi:MAG: nucleotidyl transferase AbiEii/AbiGii toxin family protein [Elusimicrobiaceae bacterium]|nr:nucleotidyl transferase AbiEii/AbiGii toxin family protein [Elusimicrobiaceae bacterium]